MNCLVPYNASVGTSYISIMVVWGVIWMVGILVAIVTWYIYYILKMSFMEMNDGSDDTTK